MDSITLINQGKTIAIKTDYNTGNTEVRKIQGAKWVSATKEWHVPIEMKKEVDAIFEKKKPKEPVAQITGDTLDIGDPVTSKVEDYSDKSIVVYGHQTEEIEKKFKEMGGLHNMRLRNGEGWIFRKNQRESVESIFSNVEQTKETKEARVPEQNVKVPEETKIIKQKPSFYNVVHETIKTVNRSEASKSVSVIGSETYIKFSIRNDDDEFNIFDISDESFRRYAMEIFPKPMYMVDDIMKTLNRRITAIRLPLLASLSYSTTVGQSVIFSEGKELYVIKGSRSAIGNASINELLYIATNPIRENGNIFAIINFRQVDINSLNTFKYKYVDKSIVFENDNMIVTISDDDIYAYDVEKFFNILRKVIKGERNDEFIVKIEKKFLKFNCQR